MEAIPRTLADLQQLGTAYAQSDPRYLDQSGDEHGLPRESEDERKWESWFWKHLAVNFKNGTRLYANGSPLRATRIKIWAEDIKWKFATVRDAVITTPHGHGGSADSGWRFPRMPRFGIVLYQRGGDQFAVLGDSYSSAQELQISNGEDIYIAVNDTTGQGHFADNSGAFSINIEVLQP